MSLATTLVTASNLCDASGNKIARARISWQPVSSVTGQPISFRYGGGGQASSQGVTAAVTNGAFTITVADTSQTYPANIGYKVTVVDAVSGQTLLSQGYGCVQPTGGNFDFDQYDPSLPTQVTVQTGPGFVARGAYAAGRSYGVGDVVTAGGSSYVSLTQNNAGNNPTMSPSSWLLMAAAGTANFEDIGLSPLNQGGQTSTVIGSIPGGLGGTPPAGVTVIPGTPFASSGYLTQFSAALSAGTAGEMLTVYVLDGNGQSTTHVLASFTVTLASTFSALTTVTFSSASGQFSQAQVAAGQYIGFGLPSDSTMPYASVADQAVTLGSVSEGIYSGSYYAGLAVGFSATVTAGGTVTWPAVATQSYVNNALAAATAVSTAGLTTLPPYRSRLWAEHFAGTSLPAGWVGSGPGAWTVNSGLLSPASGVSPWASQMIFTHAFGLDKRTIRFSFQLLTTGAVVGFGGFPAPTGYGSGQGVVSIDGNANVMNIHGGWTPGNAPGLYASQPLGFVMSVGPVYQAVLLLDHNVLTFSVTDPMTGITSSMTTGDNTGTSFPSSFFADYLGFVALSGQFKVTSLTTVANIPNAPKPTVMFLGDSITWGVSLGDAARWTTIVGNQVAARSYVVSGRPGDNSTGALARITNELQYVQPQFVVLLIGTNDTGFMSTAASESNITAIIAQAQSYGVTVILCALPTGVSTQTAFNANLLTRGLSVVRFDLATSVNNDGVTQDASLFISDRVHPNAAGAAAMAARFQIDAPELFG